MNRSNSNEKQHREWQREGHRRSQTQKPGQKRSIMSLNSARIGDRLWIAGYQSKDGINLLLGMGLAPGIAIEVIQNLAGNIIIGT